MTVLHWTVWENGEESGKSETWVLSRTDQINFLKEFFSQIWHGIERNGRFSEEYFPIFAVVAVFQILPVAIPNSTCSY